LGLALAGGALVADDGKRLLLVCVVCDRFVSRARLGTQIRGVFTAQNGWKGVSGGHPIHSIKVS
jgi:hypothetical protein